jgi:hypothetical protein
MNNGFPINVLKYVNEEDKPDDSSENKKKVINILLVEDDEKSHYVFIKNIRGFIRSGNSNNINLYACDKCMCKFKLQSAYENHKKKNKCYEYTGDAFKNLPHNGDEFCMFKDHRKKLKAPFVIYADC